MPDIYVSQIDFGDGILRSFKGEGGGGITDFVDVPTLEEDEFYADGTLKEIVFENLDTDKVTVSGITSATEVGTYTCTLTLNSESYYWKDLTNEPQIIEWKIKAHVYGVSWDGTATTTWTRTDEAADFVDPIPYVNVYPAASYSSPFDNIMPWSGMVVEERTGGTMVKIPKFWYKLTQDGAGMKIQIADGAQDGFSVSPAHMDRGDGKGERDVVYVGRYHSCSTYKSVQGTYPKTNITRSTARSSIRNLGTNIYQWDFAMLFTIWLLYLVEFADWNSQAKIGYGCGDGSQGTAPAGHYSMPYHTGNPETTRRTDYSFGIQYRYIEGLWDNVQDWVDGCYNASDGFYIILNPTMFSDSSGGTLVGQPTNSYPSAFSVTDIANTFVMFIPTERNGSDSTYSCDSWNYQPSYPCLLQGGYWYSQSQQNGLFYLYANPSTSKSNYYGCRLMELPSNS